MKYTKIAVAKLTAESIKKAAFELSNIAMNLAYQGLMHRNVSELIKLDTDAIRKLPAEFRQFYPLSKVKDESRYTFSGKKCENIRKFMGLTTDQSVSFEQFVEIVTGLINQEADPVELSIDEVRGKAASAAAAAVRKCFAAGLTYNQIMQIVAKIQVESEAKPAPAVVQVAQPADVAQAA